MTAYLMLKTARMVRNALFTSLLMLLAILFLFPFYTILLDSFKTTAEIFSSKLLSLPLEGFNLTNYINLLTISHYGRSLINSAFVSVSYVIVVLLLSSLAGFSFAKSKFPGRNVLFLIVLISIMLPPQITYVPLFIIISGLKWASTYQALIFPRMLQGFGLAFAIFLMRQYVAYVPAELIDAAKVDGCNHFVIYRRVVVPLTKGGLLVVGMIVFMDIWNDFLWPMIVVNKLEMYTVSLNIARLFATQREVQWGQIMAACFMSSVPLITIFLAFRRNFISGITAGALK